MGTGFEIFKGLADEVLNIGGSDDDLRRILTDTTLRKQLADLIVGKSALGDTYPVTVNYDLFLKGMIRAGGYDYANDDVTERNFRIEGDGTQEVTIELVHFDRFMSSDDVLRELDERDLRAATLPELLTFGATYPEIQRQFPIVALGSVWRNRSGNRYVPYLWGGAVERHLHLYWLGRRWGAYDRFAAVRK